MSEVLNTITSVDVQIFGIMNVKVVHTHIILLQRGRNNSLKMCDI